MSLSRETVDQLLEESRTHDCSGAPETCVRIVAVADLPTRFGEYQVVAFWNERGAT